MARQFGGEANRAELAQPIAVVTDGLTETALAHPLLRQTLKIDLRAD